MNDLKDCPWWRLYDQMLNLMTVTVSIFLHSDPTIHWPSTHARFTEQWLSPPTPPTHHHHPYLFWDLPPCDRMRRSSWDPTQHNNHSTQQSLLGMIARCEDFFFCGILTGTYAMYMYVWIYSMLSCSQTRTAESSWVMPLLTYCQVPAELNETAWI